MLVVIQYQKQKEKAKKKNTNAVAVGIYNILQFATKKNKELLEQKIIKKKLRN